jgi:hypothetical protein
MISKKFLLKQMSKIELNYGKERFNVTQDMFDLWYEMFSECEEEGLKMAVDKCIRENEFAPNIAGLMKYYKELEREREELGNLIGSQYTTIRSIWGEKFDDETYKELIAYVFRFPKKLRKVELVDLTHNAVSYYHDCEAAGRKNHPTIIQYLKGER